MGLFDKTFKNKNRDIVSEVLDKLSKEQLPEGFRYENIKNSQCLCSIVPVDNDVELKVNIPKDVDGKKFKNKDELFKYLYNTQQSIKVVGDTININGVNFKIDDIIKNPINSRLDGERSIIIAPYPFPKLEDIIIKNLRDNKEYKFEVKRKPTKKDDTIVIESINNNLIKISYEFNEETEQFKFSTNGKIDSIKTLEDIKYVSEFYLALIDNNLILKDSKNLNISINLYVNDKSSLLKFKGYFEFWKEVCELRDITKIEFEFKENINLEENNIIKKIYKSLVLKESYKVFSEIEFFEMSSLESKKEEYEEIFLNNSGAFSYIEYEDIQILGKKMKIHYVVTWFDLQVERIEEKKKNDIYINKIYVKSNKNKKMFKVERMFLDEEAADEYHNYVLKNLDKIYKENSCN